MHSRWTLSPAPDTVRTALRCKAVLAVLFVVVYGGCNWLTSRRHDTFKLYFDWELVIPLVPQMLWIYLSLFVLFLLPMFCLDRDGLLLLSRRIACGILLSGAAFLLFPAQLGYMRAAQPDSLFALIHALDHPHNLAPSLHVIMSGLIIGALRGASPPWLRRLFTVWFVLICAAVVLVHQHHLLDVLSGILVTCFVAHAVRESCAEWPGWYPRALRKGRTP